MPINEYYAEDYSREDLENYNIIYFNDYYINEEGDVYIRRTDEYLTTANRLAVLVTELNNFLDIIDYNSISINTDTISIPLDGNFEYEIKSDKVYYKDKCLGTLEELESALAKYDEI